MKASNKLLIGLLAVGVLTLVGSTVAFRAEHDQIDFNDPFYGFSSTAVKPFRVLKIEGKAGKIGEIPAPVGMVKPSGNVPDKIYSNTTITVQSGKGFEIRVQKTSNVAFTYRSDGDTLIVQYEPEIFAQSIGPGQAFVDMPFAYINTPFAYILTPSVQTLVVEGATCKVAGLSMEKVAVVATDARVLISRSTIGNLLTTGKRGSLVQTASANRIRTATITSHDSTGFIAERDVFGSILLQSDSNATVKAPASLLRKMMVN
ncbi:hypothetical protein GCM10023189_34310 [Nibrella saemangeumensis]|uniref:Auto-transporter adhesin head GIN domain-containing protein n=1 Tax=Nibrella saemangeumensis TaxID=1084526 RepID=A0ABP8N4V9_9BACT